MAKTRTSFTYKYDLDMETLTRYKDRLLPDYFAVLAHRAVKTRQDEIASYLGIPLGTVKSRLNRGMRDYNKLKAAEAATEVFQPV